MFAASLQHTMLFLLITLIAVLEAAWLLREIVPEGRDWQRIAWLLVPAVMLALVAGKPVRWPLTTNAHHICYTVRRR